MSLGKNINLEPGQTFSSACARAKASHWWPQNSSLARLGVVELGLCAVARLNDGLAQSIQPASRCAAVHTPQMLVSMEMRCLLKSDSCGNCQVVYWFMKNGTMKSRELDSSMGPGFSCSWEDLNNAPRPTRQNCPQRHGFGSTRAFC